MYVGRKMGLVNRVQIQGKMIAFIFAKNTLGKCINPSLLSANGLNNRVD